MTNGTTGTKPVPWVTKRSFRAAHLSAGRGSDELPLRERRLCRWTAAGACLVALHSLK